MEPINYSIDVESPFAAMAKGYQFGAGMRENEIQQQQQQAMAKDLHEVSLNPTPQAIASLSVKYPQLGDKLKAPFEMMDSQQKEAKIQTAVPIYAAIQSGDYKVALDKLEEQAVAYDNSGDQKQADSTRAIAKMVEDHPKNAKFTLGMYLAQGMGYKEFANTFSQFQKTQTEQEKLPYETSKLQAETEIKNIEAANLPEEKAANLEKLYQDVETSKLDRKIKVLDVKIKKANSETEREKLQAEKDKTQAALDEKRTVKTEAAQKSISNIATSKELIQKALNHPGLEGATGVDGAINRLFSGTDYADFESLVDTLKSRQFLDAIPQMTGMGALSEKEGAKLESSITSLSLRQKATTFRENLKYALGILNKAESALNASGKLPTEGGGFIMKHPELGNITEGTVNRLLRDHPEATRDDIMQWLKATGGE